MAQGDFHFYRLYWIGKYTDIEGKKTRSPSYYANIIVEEGAVGSYDTEDLRMDDLINIAKEGCKWFANGVKKDTNDNITFADLYSVRIEKVLCGRDLGSVWKGGLSYPNNAVRFGMGILPIDREVGKTIFLREAHYRDDISNELSRLTVEPISVVEFEDDENECFPVFALVSVIDGMDKVRLMNNLFDRAIVSDIDNQFITKR